MTSTPQQRFDRAIAMKSRGHTYLELIAITGWSRITVMHKISLLRAAGQVYIDSYTDDSRGRKIVSVFRSGNQPDAPRPGLSESNAERMRKYNQRKREELAHYKTLIGKTPGGPRPDAGRPRAPIDAKRVLKRLANGESMRAIAESLGVSPDAIRTIKLKGEKNA